MDVWLRVSVNGREIRARGGAGNTIYGLLTTAEECLDMAGVILFIRCFLRLAAQAGRALTRSISTPASSAAPAP